MAVIYFDNGQKADGVIVKTGRTASPQQPRRSRLTAPTAPAEAAEIAAPSAKRPGVTAIVRIP